MMRLTNIKRSLLVRRAMQAYLRRRALKLTIVNINLLYVVFEFGPCITCTAVHQIMLQLRRGAHPDATKQYIKELHDQGLVGIAEGKGRRYFITTEGRRALTDFEKTLRGLRFTKSDIKPRKIKGNGTKGN